METPNINMNQNIKEEGDQSMMNLITTLVELVQDLFTKTNDQINVGVLKLGHVSLLSFSPTTPAFDDRGGVS